MDHQRLSVCFADLTHYARLVETLGDEAALDVLQDLYRTAGDSIVQHGGRIRKYIGDASSSPSMIRSTPFAPPMRSPARSAISTR